MNLLHPRTLLTPLTATAPAERAASLLPRAAARGTAIVLALVVIVSVVLATPPPTGRAWSSPGWPR
jgi:hypothetical protein